MIETIKGLAESGPGGVKFHKKTLYPALSPFPPRGPYFADDSKDSRIIEWHKAHSDEFDLSCYYSGDITVSGIGHLWSGDKLILEPSLMPPYWRRLVFDNPKSRPAEEVGLPTRVIVEPCINALGWGFNIYGHVIIEMLPRILTALKLSDADNKPPKVLIRSDSPDWLKGIISSILPYGADSIIEFDPSAERVKLEHGIFPTYPYFGQGFHPYVQDLLNAMPGLPAHNETRHGHYYVARSLVPDVKGRRICTNEANLIRIAQDEYSMIVVSPETMSWAEQIKLFRSAESVVGLSGSGLHTAIFSDSQLVVGTVGLVNAVQTHISSLRRQQIAYQVADFDLGGSYEVPVDKFRRMLERITSR